MSAFTAIRPESRTSTQVRRQGVNARIQEQTRHEQRTQARERMVAGAKSASLKAGIALAIGAVLAVSAVFAWKAASDPRWTGLRAIEIRGAAHLGAQVATESGLRFGDGLSGIDLDAARVRLLADPWIREVRVSRRWPHRVLVRVVERTPVAEVSAERWIAADGTILPRRGEAELPRFLAKGFPGGRVPRSLACGALQAVGSMDAAGMTEFDQIAVLRDGALELSGRNGGPMVLVAPADWRKGLARWGALKEELGTKMALFREIDLRHGACASLRRAEGGV
jgi:hypothetical protein